MSVDPERIRAEFGGDHVASEQTFMMGIDHRFTKQMAERFRGRRVLETCTGAGFTAIALAREAIRNFEGLQEESQGDSHAKVHEV